MLKASHCTVRLATWSIHMYGPRKFIGNFRSPSCFPVYSNIYGARRDARQVCGGGGILKKIWACPRWGFQSDWVEPPQTAPRAPGERKYRKYRSEAGRAQATQQGPQNHLEKFAWEELGSWLSQSTAQNHPFHLRGRRHFSQFEGRGWGSEVMDGGGCVLPLGSRSISSGSGSVHTLASCGFGFCTEGTCRKHVEAGFWRGTQLKGDIFLKRRRSWVL